MTDQQRPNTEVDAAIATRNASAEWTAALFSEQETVVALDSEGRITRYHRDGTVTRLD